MLKSLLLAFCLLPLTGCMYYRVTEPAGGKTYYTDNWHMTRFMNGGLQFYDYGTKSQITLQSSELKAVSKDEVPIAP